MSTVIPNIYFDRLLQLRLVVERDLHGHPFLAAAPIVAGHVVVGHWLLTRQSRADRRRDEAREQERARTRERTRMDPPDDAGRFS